MPVPEEHVRPDVPGTTVRLLTGPANFAGQATAWGDALAASRDDVAALTYQIHVPGGFDFPADYEVSKQTYRRSKTWQEEHFAWVTGEFTHVMIEACRPLFADLFRVSVFREAKALRDAGLTVGMMMHGSDVRIPSLHAAAHDYSPFRNREWQEVPRLERESRANVKRLRRFDGPVFVSTPDLLDFVDATWCPVVVDGARWKAPAPSGKRRKPIVVHAPSRSVVKGSNYVDAEIGPLDDDGEIAYERVSGVPAAEMPAVYRRADIVLDQFTLGSYGVAACEAMAAGRVVVGNVTRAVRDHVKKETGMDLPIVQAAPGEIGRVVAEIADDQAAFAEIGARGVEFVAAVHSGARSAEVLAAGFELTGARA